MKNLLLFSGLLLASVISTNCQESNDSFNLEETFNKDLSEQERNNINAMIQILDAQIEIDSGNAKPYFERGLLYARLGLHPKAIKDYTSAIRKDSAMGKAYFERAISKARFSYTGLWTKEACMDVKQAADLGYNEAVREYPVRCKRHIQELEGTDNSTVSD